MVPHALGPERYAKQPTQWRSGPPLEAAACWKVSLGSIDLNRDDGVLQDSAAGRPPRTVPAPTSTSPSTAGRPRQKWAGLRGRSTSSLADGLLNSGRS